MPAVVNLPSPAKYRLLPTGKRPSIPQDDIPLSQIDATLPLQDSGDPDRDANWQRVRNYWLILCYFLHALLVALHVVLLAISTLNHAERRIAFPFDNEVFSIGLSAGLQAFYALYTALLVFVTQSLVLSALFSTPKKLTQIHDVCGAWSGLGAALSALWSQIRVPSSVWSIVLVTVYFACISVLHVTSSTIMQLQPFNETVTKTIPAVATWPGMSTNLGSLDWLAVTTLVPFLQSLYGTTTDGLANNILYDVPTNRFANAVVNATTLSAHCGVLTNLSIDTKGTSEWNVNVSLSNVDPFSIGVSYPPLLNEIWFSPSINSECMRSQNCMNAILYLVSAAIDIGDGTDGTDHVHINGTYFPPGGAPQNFTTPIYFVACSLDAETHVATLSSSGIVLDLAEQPMDMAWSTFSLGGDANLTSAISLAMSSANSLPLSPYCQPIMLYPQLWANITGFNAYIRSVLGMGTSPCNGTSLARYTTPSLLTKGQMENAVSRIATEFIWLAGELGNVGGGFNRQTNESQATEYILLWRLNINLFPVIAALCASVVIYVIVICMLWGRNTRAAAVSAAGVLEIMWLGSHSRILRDHLREMRNPSVDNLRASSMFEITFWAHSTQTPMSKGSNGVYAAIPSDDLGGHANSSGSLGSLEFAPGGSVHSNDLYKHNAIPHAATTSRIRRWCYVLHTIFAALHVILLALLAGHPEHSVVIPFEDSTLTIGLSAFLQAFYTLYSALLVVIMQRLALFRIVLERQKLTTVHDISGAWTGIGAAIYILWQQRRTSSSILGVTAIATYLILMLLLHITSSSIMQWQAFNSTLVSALPSNLALPDGAVNISQLGWVEIFPIAHTISQDTGVSTYGLSDSTLYDVPHSAATNVTFSEASVNATTLNVQCGLVSNLTLSYGPVPNFVDLVSSSEAYQISFSLNGTESGSFFEPPIWKDVVYSITPAKQCTACTQTLFYMVTTGVDADESVHGTVSFNMNWTYTPSGESPQVSKTVAYIAACSIAAHTTPAILNLQTEQLVPYVGQAALSNRTSWSAWSPGNATSFSIGMATALKHDISGAFPFFSQGEHSAYFTDMDSYLMSLLGLDLASADARSASRSSANPSMTLSPSRLENALAQIAARFLWVAGQLGETGGGFQRVVGESRATRNVLQWRLNLNTVPVVIASIASFTALALVRFIIGKRPSRGHSPLVSGTSVLESLWLEANSEALHGRLKTVEVPRSDRLRAAGMFEVSFGDIGRSSSAGPTGQK